MTHTTEQPGLHAHSWNPDDDLMKRFLVYEKTPMGYWLAIKSFENYYAADEWLVFQHENDPRPTFILLSQSKEQKAEYKKVLTTGGEYTFANGNVYKIVDQFHTP